MKMVSQGINGVFFRTSFWQKAIPVLILHIVFLASALWNGSALTDDSIQYLRLADNLVEHGVFSQSYLQPFTEDVQRTPGYPLFLILLGRWVPLIMIVQHLLGIATSFLLFRGIKAMGHEKAAVITAWTFAIMPYSLVFSSMILSETLFVFLLAIAFLNTINGLHRHSTPQLLVASLGWGAAVLVRPVAWPMLVVTVVIVMVWWWRNPGKRHSSILILGLAMLLPAGWMVRNHSLAGSFYLSTMGEMGMLHGRLGGLVAMRNGKSMDEHNLYMGGDSIGATKIGFPNLRNYPIDVQTHETERFDGRVNQLTWQYFFNHPLDGIMFQAKQVFVMFVGLGKGWTEKLFQSNWAAWIFAGLQGMICMFMYIGLAYSVLHFKHWTRAEWLGFAIVTVALVVSAAAWSDGRYRMVIDFLMLMMAAMVWERLASQKLAQKAV